MNEPEHISVGLRELLAEWADGAEGRIATARAAIREAKEA